MIRVEKRPDGMSEITIGPFKDPVLAQHVADTIRGLAEEGGALEAGAIPGNVVHAIAKGERHLEEDAGHYVVRVDGAPGAPRKVDYSAGGTIRTKTA